MKEFNIDRIRADFPILTREVYGKPLVYFDNAATTQKPRQVIEKITEMYSTVNANVHRG
ncbi:MAG: aminotransferase class V-fold PLP-dependent enzyme, partial [Proteiniphilum sp.]